MSGWTVVTLRAREGIDYEHARYNDADRWDATADLVASLDADDRVLKWTTWSSHVYALLDEPRYAFWAAEQFLEDYAHLIDAAVVLGANDTSDTGEARYYPDPRGDAADRYAEDQSVDGTKTGEIALAKMTARHGIVARDPFHNRCGLLDGTYADEGTLRTSDETTNVTTDQ